MNDMLIIVVTLSIAIACIVHIIQLVGQHKYHEIPASLGFSMYVYLCFHVFVGLPPNTQPLVLSPVARVVGAVLFLAATAVFFWCARLLDCHKEKLAHLPETPQLVMCGPYKHVRHPMYAATAIALLGIVLIWPTFFAIGTSLLTFIALWLGARLEDEHIIGMYGDIYTAYLQRTKLLLPFII